MLFITFMQNDFISNTVLPDKKTGHYKINHNISSFDEDINVDGINGQWVISSGENYKICRYNGDKKTYYRERTVISDNDVLVIEINGMEFTIIVEKISSEKNKFCKFCFASDVTEYTFRIGKKQDNDICLDDDYISGNHAVLFKTDGKWYIIDTNSKNGTYVNNKRIVSDEEYSLDVGDVVFIVGYKFIICSDFISANIDFEKSLRGNRLKNVVLSKFELESKRKKIDDTNYFYRTVDLGANSIEFDAVKLLPPERSMIREEQPILLSIGSSLTMACTTVLVALYSGVAAYYRQTNFSYIVPTFIMAGGMLMSTFCMPPIMTFYKNKLSKKNEKKRIEEYQNYIMQLRDTVNAMIDEERNFLLKKYLTIDECIERVVNRDRYLWSKSINDNDFMCVVAGMGKRKSSVKVDFHAESEYFFKDNLRRDMMQFAHEERYINNAPMTISLNNGCICGVSGEKDISCEFIKSLVIQLASLYSYDELKLVFIYDSNDEEKWSYAKWLPHTWNSDTSFRFVASSSDEIKELAYNLEKEYNDRTDKKDEDFPKMLIIASDKKLFESINIMPMIMKNRTALNISILTSFGMYNYNNSNIIVELSDNQSKIYDRDNNVVSEFVPFDLKKYEHEFDRYISAISNIKLDISTEKYQLPKMLTFLEMFKVSKVEHLNCLTRWAENNPIKSLKTEIGVEPSGDTFFIDMHEKFHGPHGLMAGTTGSGKSETIITIILSLAVNYSPEEVAFVIVDYKGGGLADAFNYVKEVTENGKKREIKCKLPHVLGTVTNLDGSIIERACISIDTELKRRQKLFKTARKMSNEGTMDIYRYQELRREGMDIDALPHLFIVCDEFSELKSDRDDFMKLLIRSARIGRSLGVHLILATQKPDNAVGPEIWSNSRFKICLKVQDGTDSKAVIRRPDAAEISTTGRFYFQVGYNEVFSMGQSAWCGADYVESDEFVRNDVEALEVISNTGTVLYTKSKKAVPKINSSENQQKHISQLVAVREYLIDIAKDIEMRPLWLDALPAHISLRQLYEEQKKHSYSDFVPLEPIIGKRDDLYEREQKIMNISFSKKGNVIVYGATGSGLDMFFITLIYSFIYAYTSEQVNIYVLDFDAGFLKTTFEKAPHVGDVITIDDSENVRKIIYSIKDEVVRRTSLFAEYNGEYEKYCRSNGQKLPNIVLILNNYTEFKEKFSDDISALTYIAREGVKRGIFIVIGTSTISTNFNLKQYIQQIFMLKMNDTNDYISILGRTDRITPSECKGSGIVKEKNITYKFQIAEIFDVDDIIEDDENETVFGDDAKEIAELCKNAVENCNDVYAPSYKNIRISVENILEDKLDYSNLPLGAYGSDVVYYDFSDKYITFISAESETKLTRFSAYLAEALSRDDSISVHLLDSSGDIEHENSRYTYISTPEQLIEWSRNFSNMYVDRYHQLEKQPDGTWVIKQGVELSHMYVIVNSFEGNVINDETNSVFTCLKQAITQLPEIHIHYIILDTPKKMHAEKGAYFHIVKDIDKDKIDFESIDVENHRDWFDASGIWIGRGLEKSGLFKIENNIPVMMEDEAVIIQNRKAGKRFTILNN
ncbi:MAG: type VII secretion protein EssC [Ruminococcus sp.]|nr:type VII secretion protein EssC [Ruminococcus sp.]